MNSHFMNRYEALRATYEILVIEYEILKTTHQQVLRTSKYLRSINSELRITSHHIKGCIELPKIKKDAGINLKVYTCVLLTAFLLQAEQQSHAT